MKSNKKEESFWFKLKLKNNKTLNSKSRNEEQNEEEIDINIEEEIDEDEEFGDLILNQTQNDHHRHSGKNKVFNLKIKFHVYRKYWFFDF